MATPRPTDVEPRVDSRALDASLAAVRPLVIPTRPAADESLAGLVARATEQNVLGSAGVILSDLGLISFRPGAIGKDIGDAGPRLALKIGCSEDEIAHRAHRYLGRRGRSGLVNWGGTSLLRSDLTFDRRRISPAALQAQEHHRASWMTVLMPYCPVSFERLIDECGACGSALGWKGARGIGTCEHCRRRIEHPDGELLPEELRDAYAAFSRLVSIDPSVRTNQTTELPESLRPLGTSSLIDLVLTTGRVFVPEAADARRDRFSVVAPLAAARIVACGTDMLADWPGRLRARLADRDLLDEEGERAAIHSLQWRVWDREDEPESGILREALPELYVQGRKSLRSLAIPMMDPSELRRRTGFSNAQWLALAGSGTLGRTETTGRKRASVRVERAVAEDLIAKKDGSEPASKLEGRLGLPTYAIEQLACMGEVTHADHPGFRALGLEIRITSESAAALIANLEEGARGAHDRRALPLHRLALRFCGSEKPWGSILSALRHRRLPYALLPESDPGRPWRRPLVRRILVRPEDLLGRDFASLEVAAHADFPFEADLSQKDAMEILGATSFQLANAVDAGTVTFVKGYGNAMVTDRREVSRLARTFAGTAEVGMKIGISDHQMTSKEIDRRGGLERFALGWRRDGLSEVFPEIFRPSPPDAE